MAKRKRKRKKDGRNNGVTRFKSIMSAANALKHRYDVAMSSMTVLSCCKLPNDEYFIFQELRSFPVANIIASKPNNSIMFTCDFHFFDIALDHKKTNIEEKDKLGTRYVQWEEIYPSYRKPNFHNFAPERYGRYRKSWVTHLKGRERLAGLGCRVEDVKTINMYEWGFEVISDMLCMLVLDEDSYNIRHIVKKQGEKDAKLDVDFMGGRFRIKDLKKEVTGYWTREDDHEMLEGDKRIDAAVIGNKFEKVYDIGQVNKSFIDLEEDEDE